MENKICKNCSRSFTVFDEDLKFYDRISPTFNSKKFKIPSPIFCPDCRQQRRLTYRNEKTFYKRKCDKSGKEIVSIYKPEFKGTVYSIEEWWKDHWDPKKYGQDFDFNRTFFEQFNELSLKVPRPCIVNMSSENSIYTNHSAYNKNCYMCINTGYCEDLFYCTNYNLYNKNCADCLTIQKCERCYFCINSMQCAFSTYLLESRNCTDCNFCYNCKGCNNCFGCWNLRHKSFCIFNEQYSKSEYDEKLTKLKPKTWHEYQKFFEDYCSKIKENAVHRAIVVEKCLNSTGDRLLNCKNVQNTYYTFESEDCSYCYDCGEMKSCYDTFEPFRGELQFETHGCNLGYNLKFTSKCYENNNLIYCQYCWYSSELFGCFGMRRAKHCILNKQYSEEEYRKLVARIIEHLQKTGEWGEFFDSKYSTFGYNETAANYYYPMTRAEVLKKGWKWDDDEEKTTREQTTREQTKNDICDQILICEKTHVPFRIIPQELEFYRKMNLPIPGECFNCRLQKRLDLRNPRKLWKIKCTKCGVETDTSYPPENRPKKIFCQECYLKEVY